MFPKTFTILAAVLVVLAPLCGADPYAQADDTWISLNGTIVSTAPDAFVLDYGKGTITVEMDDWDWYDESIGLLAGDKVTVYGKVDDDLFEKTTIEASSVYDESLGSYFYASAADEEDYAVVTLGPIVFGEMTVRGKVTNVDKDNGTFTVDTGLRQLTVDVNDLGYNPLDDVGFQKVKVGQRVRVNGLMEEDLFTTRKLDADWLVILSDDAGKNGSGKTKKTMKTEK